MVSTNLGSGRPRRGSRSKRWCHTMQGITSTCHGRSWYGTSHPIQMCFSGWFGESKVLREMGASFLGPPQPGRCAPQLAVPAFCSSWSFPEMPVDKPMESTLQLSRHQPHSIPPEISFVVEVGSVPRGGVICVENIIIAKWAPLIDSKFCRIPS